MKLLIPIIVDYFGRIPANVEVAKMLPNTERKNCPGKITFKNMSMKERLKFVGEVVTIEPLICCVVAAAVLSQPATTNLQFEKACKVNAGFNDTVCEAILSGTYLEKNFQEQNHVVQHYITNLRSWEIPVASIVPVILVIFLGSYSDRHRIRKPFLLMPFFGGLVSMIGSILNVIYLYEWSLEVQAVCDRIIPSFFGAEKLAMMISGAYIADISTLEMRTVRMAIIPILIHITVPISQSVSGILFRAVGYIPVFSITFCLFSIALLYGIFMIKEPLKTQSKVLESKKELFLDIFNAKHVVETFTFLKKHKGRERRNILFVLVLCFIHTFINSGEESTFYLFTQTAYQWTVVDFSYFSTASTLVNLIGLSVFVPLFAKGLNLHDLPIIAISYLDAIAANAVFVAVQSTLGVYLGRVLSVLKSPGQTATRSQLSKHVSSDDMAKVMCLNTVVSAIAAAISAQVYHKGIYEYTRKTFPHAFFLLGMSIYAIGVAPVISPSQPGIKEEREDI